MMIFLVHSDNIYPCIRFGTHVAMISDLSFMQVFLVYLELLFGFKGLVTFFAWIWFLVGMAIFMCLKGSSLCEKFATLTTGERLIPLVNPLVFIQISS